MARATPPTVTDADLRRACRDLRRSTWPESFEEVMQDPIRSRLVRLQATHNVRTELHRMALYLKKHPHVLGAGPYGAIAGTTRDCKRAAAGDRDD